MLSEEIKETNALDWKKRILEAKKLTVVELIELLKKCLKMHLYGMRGVIVMERQTVWF